MIKQDFLINYEEKDKELYVRGICNQIKEGLSISKGERLYFDTYFNMFSVCKWKKYTRVKNIGLHLELQGNCALRICGINLGDSDHPFIIKEFEVNNTTVFEEACISTTINELPDFIYLEIFANEDTNIYLIQYLLDVQPTIVKICCCICTYKREKDIEKNLHELAGGILNNQNSILYKNLEVFIADNGNSLNLFEDEELKDYENLIHVFPNKNYGGSAGFTRCMIEAVFNDVEHGFDYLILMDDDATIKSAVLEKTAAFLMSIKPEFRDYFLGGSMLFLETPSIQKENGCYFKNGHLVMKNYFADLSNRNSVIANEIEQRLDYNGWYFCCIPTRVISNNLLPVPLFFTWDDAEYGIRNAKGKIITLNGICIWHPAHDAKPGSFRNYYGMRNTCIMRSEFEPNISFNQIEKVFIRRILLFLMQYQYNSAKYLLLGIRDFYRGIAWYREQDAEKLNNIVRTSFPDTNAATLENCDVNYADGKPMSKRKWLLRMLINSFCPGQRRVYEIETPRNTVDYLFTNEVMFINKNTNTGYTFKRDYKEAASIIQDYLVLRKEIKTKHEKIWKEWHSRICELETLEYWKYILNI